MVPEGGAGREALLAPQFAAWTRLVFQSARNGHDWEVYGARGDGSEQANISNHGSVDIQPRLNRGATRVVFTSNRDGNYEIYAMNADGSGQWRLTANDASDTYPAWSPDGGRIVFQSYRDDQAELYVMNADGSGQARLTYHPEYDGEAAWSPDGAQIAFTRRSEGEYRIWVMNADGSGARQLSSQRNSENPAWSPDGSQIAYDANGSGDGWQEIWVMDAAGGNQRQLYDPSEFNTDVWVRSWSPDGRHIAFTRISWVQQGSAWYWTYAYLDAVEVQNPSSVLRLSDTGDDWNPDWQPTDVQAPTSFVWELPAQSPGPFVVSWSGTDAGPAGVANFDVQVRLGPSGEWMDWQQATPGLSASYPGGGGRTYYFRSRARDNAGNVEPWPADYDAQTTVEALPPITSMEPLLPYSHAPIWVRWSGTDPGGSGIQRYEVQFRVDDGAWTYWSLGAIDTSALFSEWPGRQCSFRVRGIDNAGNEEPWPDGADATTMTYTWAVAGTATDNRGAPVMGVAVTTAPAALHTAPSDDGGAYIAHVADAAENYTANWNKAGYGSLPATAYRAGQDARADLVLPPADNAVQNWGFESGNDAWQTAGSLTTTITDTARHTGASAAFLGSEVNPFGPVTIVADMKNFAGVDSAIDAAGVIHAIWSGPDGYVMHSSTPPAGSWTVPVRLPDPAGDLPKLLVDGTGTIHALWCSESAPRGLYYSRRQPGAGWSGSERIPGTDAYASEPGLAMGAAGVVKVAWTMEEMGPYDRLYPVYFSQRQSGGVWTSPQKLSTDDALAWTMIATDPAGAAHVLWKNKGDGSTESFFYRAQSPDGSWLPAVTLSQDSINASADMIVDSHGTVHVAWIDGNGVYYRQRPAGGSWISTEKPIESSGGWSVSMAVDRLGNAHLAWNAAWGALQMRYATRTNGVWSLPVGLAPPTTQSAYYALPAIAVNADLTVHVLWSELNQADAQASSVRYSARGADGGWSPATYVYQGPYSHQPPHLLLDGSEKPHAIWASSKGDVWKVMYAGPAPASAAGEAILSQPVQIPPAASAPTLSFLHRFGAESSSNSRLEAIVDDGVSPTVVFSANTGADAWTHAWADLTPWAGRSVTLRFRLIDAGGAAHAWATLDEVTVGSAHPDIWVSQSCPAAAAPGQEFVQAASYGNRGGVAAGDGRVTLQLPPGLLFVRADPPPSATTPVLRWDVGGLAAQSTPQPILVTLQVAPSVAVGTVLTAAAGITSDTADLEQANNSATAAIRVDYPDLWVSQAGPSRAAPGQQFVQTITYGNQGSAFASNGRVTLQLPPGLALISADPPPSAASPDLRWDVGDLAVQSTPQPILVTLQVAPSAEAGTTLTAVAAIASDTAELEQANNNAEADLDIRALLYLPVIRR